MMRTMWRVAMLAGLWGLVSAPAFAAGHGPAFALGTPTLGEGAWSSDTSLMNLTTEEGEAFMLREMLAYGITEDITASLSFPLVAGSNDLRLKNPPRTRGQAMMGGFSEVEGGLWWRFDKRYPGAGQRYESTLYINAAVPIDEERGGIGVGPSVNMALATGYASRAWYWWAAAGYQHYLKRGNDRLGGLPYLTAAVGYRPPIFQQDYPKPDLRFFLETVAEFPERDERDGRELRDSGGTIVLAGPSVLGLFGKYGAEAGVLFPVHEDLNGDQPDETVRATLDFVVWF